MKHIFRVLTMLSVVGIIGTIGAYDTNYLTLGQAILQFSISLILLYAGVTMLKKLECKTEHFVLCNENENVIGHTINNSDVA